MVNLFTRSPLAVALGVGNYTGSIKKKTKYTDYILSCQLMQTNNRSSKTCVCFSDLQACFSTFSGHVDSR